MSGKVAARLVGPAKRGLDRAVGRRVIGHRAGIARGYTTATSQNSLNSESRILFRTGPVGASQIQLGYGSWWDSDGAQAAGTGERAVGMDATLTCGIERVTPAGIVIPGRFGGQTSAILKAGDPLMFCDPIPVYLEPNSAFYVQSGHKVATFNADGVSGDWHPVFATRCHSGDQFLRCDSAFTRVGVAGTWSAPGGGTISPVAFNGWGPCLLTGIPDIDTVSLILFGNSRISGTGDTQAASGVVGGDGYGNVGYGGRAVGNLDGAGNSVIPYAYFCRPGNRMSYEDYNPSYRKRLAYRYFTHALWDNAVNDISGPTQGQTGASLATLQALALRNFAEFKAAGLHVTVMLQITKTVGAWTLADGSDQTLWSSDFAPGGTCDQFNAWLLSLEGGGLVDKVLDPRPLVQNMTTNKWLADGTANKFTADGTHQTPYAHALLADNLVRPWARQLSV